MKEKVIALGFFDGVHLGHAALLRRTVEEAVTLVPNAIIVGWDVAVTAQGPVLIEGNAYPSVQIMQTAGMQGLKRLWNSALWG